MRCPHCHHIIDKIPLTVNMQRVFDYIKKYSEKNNLAPTFDEIKTGCKLNNKSEIRNLLLVFFLFAEFRVLGLEIFEQLLVLLLLICG